MNAVEKKYELTDERFDYLHKSVEKVQDRTTKMRINKHPLHCLFWEMRKMINMCAEDSAFRNIKIKESFDPWYKLNKDERFLKSIDNESETLEIDPHNLVEVLIIYSKLIYAIEEERKHF